MSVDVKKHTSIAAGEKPTRAGLAAAIFSINDVIPVANSTEATQVVQAVVAAGQAVASSPVTVSRANARGLHRIEICFDPTGAIWLPASGILTFASKAAADSWGSSNAAYLTAGDSCWVGFTQYLWTGSAWIGGTSGITFTGAYSSSGTTPVLAAIEGHRAYLEGVVVSTSQTYAAGTSYTLANAGGVPAAFCPLMNQSFVCTSNATAVAAVTVTTAGAISIVLNVGFTGALALNLGGISWRIA